MMCPRPWRAVRAATSMRSRRRVAPRALAQARLARDPAARSRLCAIGGERARGQVSQGPVGPVREDLLDDGVVAVLLLGLDEGKRGIGEHRVVAPDGKQLVLALGGLMVEVFDPADDQAGGDGLVLLGGERGVFGLGWASRRPGRC